MSPSQVYEPTYRSIKQRLLSGVWPTGMRLEAARIAEDLQVSASPVRDCLNRLAGERLIEARHREGFHVPRLDTQTVQELLAINHALLLTSLAIGTLQPIGPEDDRTDHADRTAAVFRHLATQGCNAELTLLIDSISDRLHLLRRIEERVLPAPGKELEALIEGLAHGLPLRDLRAALRHYHERRERSADRLLRSVPSI